MNLFYNFKIKKSKEKALELLRNRCAYLTLISMGVLKIEEKVKSSNLKLDALNELLKDLSFETKDNYQRSRKLIDCLNEDDFDYVVSMSSVIDTQYNEVINLLNVLLAHAQNAGIV